MKISSSVIGSLETVTGISTQVMLDANYKLVLTKKIEEQGTENECIVFHMLIRHQGNAKTIMDASFSPEEFMTFINMQCEFLNLVGTFKEKETGAKLEEIVRKISV